MLPPMYSNWVFVTSAEVLSRAGEEDSEEDDQEKEGESTKGGWTKRQYREEGEKLRGKEWVFR